MNDETPVTRALAASGIPFRVFRHAAPPGSVEQAAAERGQEPDQVVRSIVFRLAAGEYAMVLMPGVRQVAWRALRRHFGQSRLTLASADEVLSITGYPLGAVAPFGLPHPMRILVDESVFAVEEVSLGSGERGVAIILRAADLRRALTGCTIGRFGEPL
jgi:Cys-tRNA(Pro)/Cys-tRNA(Cys) deacylase